MDRTIVDTAHLGKGTQPVMGSPTFFTSNDGVLPVNFGNVVALYITHGGGATWGISPSFANSDIDQGAVPISAVSGQTALVAVGHRLLSTHDGGATWNSVTHGAELTGVAAPGLANDHVAWALTFNGSCASFKSNFTTTATVLRTTDGGQNWSPVPIAALPSHV